MANANKSRARRGIGLGLLAAALWGLVPVATKGALAGYAPEMISVLRLGVATVVLHGLAGSDTPWLPRDGWSWMAGAALGADFILYNYGLQRTSASLSGLVINVQVVSTIAFAVWLLGERLNGRRILGSCVTLLGVAAVSGADASLTDLTAPAHLPGDLMVMLAGACWSLFAVAQRRTPRRSPLVRALAPVFAVSALTTAPLLLTRAAWHNVGGLVPTLMLLVLIWFCTITVYIVYARGQELVDVSTLAIVLATIPIFALGFARVVLLESLSPRIAVSGAVILLGVLTIASERPVGHVAEATAIGRAPSGASIVTSRGDEK
jgi:drug/metabolite transporter (DMT)-like permease